MEIKEQVLSINQVRELQELGFDVEKHSSIEHAPIYNNELKIINYYVRVKGTGGSTLVIHPNKEEDVYIPTMTIGDIMEILPEEIIVKDEDCNLFTYEFNIIKNSIYYYEFDINDDIYSSGVNKTFIDALFETLKWCIKQKHI